MRNRPLSLFVVAIIVSTLSIAPVLANGESRIGTGTLFVEGAPLLDDKHYLVNPGEVYDFTIEGITEYTGDINVWALIGLSNYLIGEVTIGSDQVEFSWEIPADLPVGTSIKIKYGISPTGPRDSWVFARRETEVAPRYMFIIPSVFLGSIGALSAMFSGAWVTSILRKKMRK